MMMIASLLTSEHKYMLFIHTFIPIVVLKAPKEQEINHDCISRVCATSGYRELSAQFWRHTRHAALMDFERSPHNFGTNLFETTNKNDTNNKNS
jgi:hypothetical protein